MPTAASKPITLIAMGLLAWAAPASAEDLALKLEATRSQVYLGESFILEVTVIGSSQPAAPDLSQIKNCRIKPLGSRDVSHYSYTIINGRMTKEGFTGRISTYEIMPTTAGVLQVGPVSVSVDGRRLSEPGPTVTVTDIEKQDLVRISVTSSRNTSLVDEPFEVTLRVLIRRLPGNFANTEPLFPNNPPSLSAPYLSGEGLAGLTLPDLKRTFQERFVSNRNQPGLTINNITVEPSLFDFSSIFQGMSGESRKAKFSLDRRIVAQDGKEYIEYSLALTFTPKDEGNYVFGPVVFKGAVPVEINAQGQAQGTPVFAVGPACTVRVIPPPDEGRPPSFTGALGTNLAVAAALDTKTANVGDPLKLTLTLAGQIRFDKMLPPKLNLQTNILRHFTVYDNTVQTVKGDNQRQYIYTLRPNHAGSFQLPPIEVSYYDTQARSYKTVATAPLPLEIKRGAEVTASQLQGFTNQLPHRQKEADLAAAAPAPIRTDPDGAKPGILLGGPWMAAVSATGPAVYLLVVLGGLIRRHSGHWKLAARRRQALGNARRQLRAARQAARSGPERAGQAIRAAICRYLTDRLGAPAGLTPGDLRNWLERAGVAVDPIAELAGIFEKYFNAEFSNQVPASGLAEDIGRAGRLLETIDRETRVRS